MNLNDFAVKVANKEGHKVQLSIGQIKEVLHVVNDLTKGLLYAIVRWMK